MNLVQVYLEYNRMVLNYKNGYNIRSGMAYRRGDGCETH
jgi:hypothetical protein